RDGGVLAAVGAGRRRLRAAPRRVGAPSAQGAHGAGARPRAHAGLAAPVAHPACEGAALEVTPPRSRRRSVAWAFVVAAWLFTGAGRAQALDDEVVTEHVRARGDVGKD